MTGGTVGRKRPLGLRAIQARQFKVVRDFRLLIGARMKLVAILLLFVCQCLANPAQAFGQNRCEFNIVGTWKAMTGTWKGLLSGDEPSHYYRFSSGGTVTVLAATGPNPSGELREASMATFTLDNAKAPRNISLNSRDSVGVLSQGPTSMEIRDYSDSWFTTLRPGADPIRWIRVDAHRHFLVFAGRRGVFYDGGGPAFAMLIKTDGRQSETDAVGIYSARGNAAFGSIPAETYTQFMKEPIDEADVMLRLEITGAQYERTLKILRSWDRRARERELLYVDLYLDNILLIKQVSESLNFCRPTVDLYRLDWGVNDYISNRNLPARAPFLFFKEMKRRNETLHVRDDRFHSGRDSTRQPAG